MECLYLLNDDSSYEWMKYSCDSLAFCCFVNESTFAWWKACAIRTSEHVCMCMCMWAHEDFDSTDCSILFVAISMFYCSDIADLAVGARGDDDGGEGRGAVHILYLNRDGTVKAGQKISDTQGGLEAPLDDFDGFGVSLAAIGDLNEE